MGRKYILDLSARVTVDLGHEITLDHKPTDEEIKTIIEEEFGNLRTREFHAFFCSAEDVVRVMPTATLKTKTSGKTIVTHIVDIGPDGKCRI